MLLFFVCSLLLITRQLIDQWIIETDYKISFFALGEYFFIIYIFFNLAYYYETEGDGRLTWEVFDWEDAPGTAVLYILFILVVLVPAASMLHYSVFRYGAIARLL